MVVTRSKTKKDRDSEGGEVTGKPRIIDRSKKSGNPWMNKAQKMWRDYASVNGVKKLMIDPEYSWVMGVFLLMCELAITSFIVLYRPYTEIDWKAYMQEVEGFLNGTRDYQKLKGDTGPLVYPAGFVYVYSALYYATDKGTDIRMAQWIFVGLYMMMMYQVFQLYATSKKVPPYALAFLTFTSYRVHSIFVLRLFNDPVALILAYASINQFLRQRWTIGSVLFSLAVSVKMNVLLYAPALLLVYLTHLSLLGTFVQLFICGILQVLLALPFLMENPWSYLSRSFDLGRVFFYEWTVNWKFLPEDIFLNRYFHYGLLAVHLIMVAAFVPVWLRCLRSHFSLDKAAKSPGGKKQMLIRSQLMLLPLILCNFIGIVFSRSLHYQFYVWYYHTIPYLLWTTAFPVPIKMGIFGLIELCWNVFPATPLSSGGLLASHILMLIGTAWYLVPKKNWSTMELGRLKSQ